jgi:NitT/TauT family transport system permease protein
VNAPLLNARLRIVLLPIASAALCLLAWQCAAVYGHLPTVILPPPIAVWQVLALHMPLLLLHAVPTAVESTLGFLIATVLGVLIATGMSYSRLAREAVYPHLILFQLIPKVALAPLFIVWLGIGPQSRLAFATFISFFPLVIATIAGLSEVPPEMIRLGTSLTATKWQVFRTIRFPYALPYVFAGMKVAVTLSMIGVIVGEFITAQRGLGYLILFAGSQSETALILASVAMLCAIGLAQFALVALAERQVRAWFGDK